MLAERACKLGQQAFSLSCRYAIAGEGPERSFLEALVDQLELQDKVQFMGSVVAQEKLNLLRNADFFVMPSRFDAVTPWQESFGIAFAEAAASAAVGSKSGGIPGAEVDGETAFWYGRSLLRTSQTG